MDSKHEPLSNAKDTSYQWSKPANDILQWRKGALFFYKPVIVIYMDDTIMCGYDDLKLT